jgi:hypothetical protein
VVRTGLGNYFDVLGAKPSKGRTFTRDEYGDRAKAFTAVISYRLWQGYFRGGPSILARSVRINRHEVTIVGVAPPVFHGDFPGIALDGWIPAALTGERERDARDFQAIVRLKPGVSIAQANAEVATVAARLASAFPRPTGESAPGSYRSGRRRTGGVKHFGVAAGHPRRGLFY